MLRSDFAKNVVRLGSSSIVAMAISLLSLPIITRLYSPDDFGQFQLLLSTVGLFSVISSFRYEMAIVLPSSKSEANSIFSLALLLLCITTIALSVSLFLFGKFFLELIDAETLEPYLLLIALAYFFAGLVQILRYMLIREKAFSDLGNNRVMESASAQGLKIGLGLFSPTFLSLFISQLVGYILSIILAQRGVTPVFVFSKRRLGFALRKYRGFLLFNTPAVFVNTLSLQLPIFMIAKSFGAEFVGYYVMAVKLIEVPLKIVGSAISQVYFKQAVDSFRLGGKELILLYIKTVKFLSLILVFPSIVIYLFSEPVIPFILGDDWSLVGRVISLLIVWKYFEFINYPVSTTLTVIGEQHVDLFLKCVFSLGLRFCALLLFNSTYTEMLYALVWSATVYYILFNVTVYLRIRRKI